MAGVGGFLRFELVPPVYAAAPVQAVPVAATALPAAHSGGSGSAVEMMVGAAAGAMFSGLASSLLGGGAAQHPQQQHAYGQPQNLAAQMAGVAATATAADQMRREMGMTPQQAIEGARQAATIAADLGITPANALRMLRTGAHVASELGVTPENAVRALASANAVSQQGPQVVQINMRR